VEANPSVGVESRAGRIIDYVNKRLLNILQRQSAEPLTAAGSKTSA
jgi:hypothetical protein